MMNVLSMFVTQILEYGLNSPEVLCHVFMRMDSQTARCEPPVSDLTEWMAPVSLFHHL